MTRSPWQRALGSRIDDLDAGLRAYFGAIPPGSVGRGEGVFDVVGVRRPWLRPLLAVLALDGVMFPVWEHAVPFTVTNRPTAHGTVRATRVFQLASGERVMHDETGITADGLTDRLGRHGFVSSTLDATVVNGGLVLTSTGATLRLGPLRVPLGVLSPRVSLVERSVERSEGSRQHVSLQLRAPIVGLLYEYEGTFTYRVEQENRG